MSNLHVMILWNLQRTQGEWVAGWFQSYFIVCCVYNKNEWLVLISKQSENITVIYKSKTNFHQLCIYYKLHLIKYEKSLQSLFVLSLKFKHYFLDCVIENIVLREQRHSIVVRGSRTWGMQTLFIRGDKKRIFIRVR